MNTFSKKLHGLFNFNNNLLGVVLILITLFFWLFKENTKPERWNFVGYQYKWSEDYVEKDGFKSEEDCVIFGNEWLDKQVSLETLFTCSLNTRPSSIAGIDTADEVCEYGRSGYIRCRK